jgi:hypothetical protein
MLAPVASTSISMSLTIGTLALAFVTSTASMYESPPPGYEGASVGSSVGAMVGNAVGTTEGAVVSSTLLGFVEGIADGELDGVPVGSALGI